MSCSRIRRLRFDERWGLVLMVSLVASGACLRAEDARPRGDGELFPQSARISRDRRIDAVLESARTQIKQQDFAGAISQLQTLLDGTHAFASGGANSQSVRDEAYRLLSEMPAAGLDAYERFRGAEAERLRQMAHQSANSEVLRQVVSRFRLTKAGWLALRDLAARHLDRGERQLAAACFEQLSQHPHAAKTTDVSWVVSWILCSSPPRAREVFVRFRDRLQQPASPVPSSPLNLSAWLESRMESPAVASDSLALLPNAPAAVPAWQQDVELEGLAGEFFQKIRDTWQDDDVLPLPSSRVLAVGDLLIARFLHPSKVIAVNSRQGKLLWERSTVSALNSAAADLQRHPVIRQSLLDELQQRWFGDSVRGRMTSDGRALFLVADVEDLDLKPGAGSRLRNHLDAWDLQSGERLWRVGSSVNQSPTGLEGQYFLGPPLVCDRTVFVVAQRETWVTLWALRADDGRVEWSLPLVETDRQQFKETHWRHVACPVTMCQGRLICPTGAGCFVAVDPVTRTLSWALRFERDDIPAAIGFGAADRERPFSSRWWESWREVSLVESSGTRADRDISLTAVHDLRNSKLLVAVPESRSLRALNPLTGDVLWSRRFAEPLFFAASSASVLVAERYGVSVLDAASGTLRHRVPTASPSGPGEWIGETYLFPANGGWIAVDANSGTVQQSVMAFSSQPNGTTSRAATASSAQIGGQFLRVGSRWALLSPAGLRLFDSLATRRSSLETRLSTKPDDVASRHELVAIARQFGELNVADEWLRPALSLAEIPDSVHREWWAIQRRLVESQPAERTRLASEWIARSRSDEERIAARQALVRAARETGELTEALRGLLDLQEQRLAGDVTIVEDGLDGLASLGPNVPTIAKSLRSVGFDNVPWRSSRVVRQDRWLQAQMADVFAAATEDQRIRLADVFAERRQRAAESTDALALQSLAEQWSSLPAGRELRLSLSGRAGIGTGYLKTHLALREITMSPDRGAAAEAWYRLALLHDFRSEPTDAADCYRELRERYADVKRSDGMTSAEWLADVMSDSPVGRLLAKEPADPWPTRIPTVTRTEEKHDDIYCPLIPVETRDPFWRRLTVSVERQGRKVRFHGTGQRGYWEVRLPPSNGIYRHAYNMFRGWGVGPLLVLQVGTELFGVQPLDDRGETNAKVLWSLMVNDADEVIGNELRLGRLGISSDDLLPLDRSEQPLLEVVHASPGLLCYRTRRRLIALDPLTGARLWMRQELPPRVTVTSDGEFVVIRMPEQQFIEVRRAFDGQLLRARRETVEPSEVLFDQGRLRLAALKPRSEKPTRTSEGIDRESSRPPTNSTGSSATVHPTELVCEDLVTGQIVWRQNLPRTSTPLRVDESRVGVLDSTGVLRFLTLHSGEELARHDVSIPPTLSQLFAFGDSLRLFVLVAGNVTDPRWLATEQDRAYRKPLANGWLHAFERGSLKRLWTIPLQNVPVALDQPHDVPFLVLPYRRPAADSPDGQHSDGVLHLIDKRTGQDLHVDVGGITNVYFTLDPNLQERQVDVLTKNHRIRFDFNEPTK